MTDLGKDSLSALIKGALAFHETEYNGDRALMGRLSKGQEPDVLMIACSDSRVDPALIFGARPGDLFVVRVVANLVPAQRSGDALAHGVMAAVEYGVKALGVSHVVVCGHSHCGGIRAAMDVGARAGTTAVRVSGHVGGAGGCGLPRGAGGGLCGRTLRGGNGSSGGTAFRSQVARELEVLFVDPGAGGKGRSRPARLVVRHRYRLFMDGGR